MIKKREAANRQQELARRAAKNSNHSLHAHGCVIYFHGHRIAAECNWNWLHAEIRAMASIRNPRHLRGAIMWSFRFLKNGDPAMAKPCPPCEEAIRASGIKTVFYSMDNGEIGRMDF